MKYIDVSIIIVNYKSEKELQDCISSIHKSQITFSYEIIVVDNDDEKIIEENLKRRFPTVKYIPNQNNGYGGGNNMGAKNAQGEYLFFLNPDTIVSKKSIDILVSDLKRNKELGIIAPFLFDKNNKPYNLQGTLELTPLRAIFAISFINKILPNNFISRKYWLKNWNRKSIHEVGTVPGTAFMIPKKLFVKIGYFDEQYFLYFEEHDICKRVLALGLKIAIDPQAKIQHFWGISTNRSKLSLQKIFQESRFYYFKKYYGIFWAYILNFLLNYGKDQLFLTIILILGSFLRLFRLNDLMVLIGDFGWFYLSARNLILTHTIPFVGITSSHPWLHQGPFWTYIVAVLFVLFHFNPLAPAYFTAILDIFTLYFLYKFGSEMFGKIIGLICAFLYSTSPLAVFDSRLPYHTSPIPFFVVFFLYCLYKWVSGNAKYFPFTIFFLAVLYNFELATAILWFPVIIVVFFGILKKKEYMRKVLNKKILFYSLAALFFPMISMIFYDFNHGFPQTLKFAAWLGYRVLKLFGYQYHQIIVPESSLSQFMNFISSQVQPLIFSPSNFVSFMLLALGFIFLLKKIFTVKNKNQINGYNLLTVSTIVSVTIFILGKTPSDAYIPIFFPMIFFTTACFFGYLIERKNKKILGITILIFVGLVNVYVFLSKNYFSQGTEYNAKIMTVNAVLTNSHGQPFQLASGGYFATIATGIDDYKYLLWWKGGIINNNSRLKYTIFNGKRSNLKNIIFSGKDATITKNER